MRTCVCRSLAGNGQSQQCAVPLRERVSWRKRCSNERDSPNELMGSPGELGQVHFPSRRESSPAGKLGTAQESFTENQSSRNRARLCPREGNCHKMRGCEGPFQPQERFQGHVRALRQEAVQLTKPSSRRFSPGHCLRWSPQLPANLAQPGRGCARPAAHMLHARRPWQGPAVPRGLRAMAILRRGRPKGPRWPLYQCWCCQQNPLPVNTTAQKTGEAQ